MEKKEKKSIHSIKWQPAGFSEPFVLWTETCLKCKHILILQANFDYLKLWKITECKFIAHKIQDFAEESQASAPLVRGALEGVEPCFVCLTIQPLLYRVHLVFNVDNTLHLNSGVQLVMIVLWTDLPCPPSTEWLPMWRQTAKCPLHTVSIKQSGEMFCCKSKYN